MPSAKQLTSRFKRKEITKKILKGLLLTGSIYIAAGSPRFTLSIMQKILRGDLSFKDIINELNTKEKKQFTDTFSYLKRQNLIEFNHRNGQVYIKLSKEGKKKARQYQIDELEIKPTKKWDNTWRIILFDIPEDIKIKREVLRGKLKELGFTMIQRSVWVIPYPCEEELKMLKKFFGFTDKHYLFIETKTLNQHERRVKKIYKLE